MAEKDHAGRRERPKLTPDTCAGVVNSGPVRHPALDDLREAARAHPSDADLRNRLGEALWQSAFDETEDHLLELRHLAAAHAGDPAPRKWLAKTLYALLYFEG